MKSPALLFTLALGLFAQQPFVENAQVTAHALSGTLATQLAALGSGPFWAGYSVPMIAGRHTSERHGDGCWDNRDGVGGRDPVAPIRLEGQTAMVVLVWVEAGKIHKLQTSSPDCSLDGGGLPFHWLVGVTVPASVAWLQTQTSGEKGDRALYPLAMHAGPEADLALDQLTAPSQPEKIRERAVFWLGNTRGAKGIEALKRMLASDPNLKVREQVVFALSNSKDPAGLATLLDAARNDKAPQIRSKALFWLTQKAAGREAQLVIGQAITDDEDRGVREQAVFALRNLPPDQGTPLLIEVAKNTPDPAVRKKAMFWLGQSRDLKALDFFAQFLK